MIFLCLPGDYSGSLLFAFENGRVARVSLSAYATTSNRRKLTGAYCDKFPLVCAVHLTEDTELALETNEPRALLVHTALLSPKTTPFYPGCAGDEHQAQVPAGKGASRGGMRHRQRCPLPDADHPRAGALLKPEDSEEKQLELL